MKRTTALCLSFLGIACNTDHARDCGGPLAGGYTIDWSRDLRACASTDVPESFALDDDLFSADGCEIHLDGDACRGGPGYCGHLYWNEHGEYEGDLTYATMTQTGNTGGYPDCLIHSEEAVLTAVDND